MSVIHRYTKLEQGEMRWEDVAVRAYSSGNSDADRATRQVPLARTSIHQISMCAISQCNPAAIPRLTGTCMTTASMCYMAVRNYAWAMQHTRSAPVT